MSKFLLCTSDETLTATDIAHGYKALYEAERGRRDLRNELDRLRLVTLATAQGTVAQRTELTPGQRRILEALALPEPPRLYGFTPAAD